MFATGTEVIRVKNFGVWESWFKHSKRAIPKQLIVRGQEVSLFGHKDSISLEGLEGVIWNCANFKEVVETPVESLKEWL